MGELTASVTQVGSLSNNMGATAEPRFTVPIVWDRGALSAKQACYYLGDISRTTLWRRVGAGLIRRTMDKTFPVYELDRYLRKQVPTGANRENREF